MARSSYRRNARRDADLRALIDEGVIAGAEAMRDAVVEKFAERGDGYTSGDFVSDPPQAANIQVSAPYTKRGVRRADVYSEGKREGKNGDAFYPAMWEFGHYNLFIDPKGETWIQVETFAPALYEMVNSIGGIMARAIKASPFTERITRRDGKTVPRLTQRAGGIQTSAKLGDFGL